MKMRNALVLMLSAAVLLTGLTGCGKKKKSEESKPKTLTIEATEAKVDNYYQPETETSLTPPMPLRLRGVSYETVTINTNVFHFNDQSFSEFLDAGNLTVDGETVRDVENPDFTFHGFALKSGDNVKLYAELVKDGELVETYSDTDKDNYEVKALYTSIELLGDNGNYFSCGTRAFTGLQRTEIETMNGKGYTSGFDKNTFYYPDVEGWTMGLGYLDGTYKTDTSASANDAQKGTEMLDEDGEPIPQMYLSELYLFKGDALLIESTE